MTRAGLDSLVKDEFAGRLSPSPGVVGTGPSPIKAWSGSGAASQTQQQAAPGNLRTNSLNRPQQLIDKLREAKPDWTEMELVDAEAKLAEIGILSISSLKESLQKHLNGRLRKHGLKAFRPSTIQELRVAVGLASQHDAAVHNRSAALAGDGAVEGNNTACADARSHAHDGIFMDSSEIGKKGSSPVVWIPLNELDDDDMPTVEGMINQVDIDEDYDIDWGGRWCVDGRKAADLSGTEDTLPVAESDPMAGLGQEEEETRLLLPCDHRIASKVARDVRDSVAFASPSDLPDDDCHQHQVRDHPKCQNEKVDHGRLAADKCDDLAFGQNDAPCSDDACSAVPPPQPAGSTCNDTNVKVNGATCNRSSLGSDAWVSNRGLADVREDQADIGGQHIATRPFPSLRPACVGSSLAPAAEPSLLIPALDELLLRLDEEELHAQSEKFLSKEQDVVEVERQARVRLAQRLADAAGAKDEDEQEASATSGKEEKSAIAACSNEELLSQRPLANTELPVKIVVGLRVKHKASGRSGVVAESPFRHPAWLLVRFNDGQVYARKADAFRAEGGQVLSCSHGCTARELGSVRCAFCSRFGTLNPADPDGRRYCSNCWVESAAWL